MDNRYLTDFTLICFYRPQSPLLFTYFMLNLHKIINPGPKFDSPKRQTSIHSSARAYNLIATHK